MPKNRNRNYRGRRNNRPNPETLVEVFFVVFRGPRDDREYALGSNKTPLNGWRKEWETETLHQGLALERVTACRNGTWWQQKRDLRGLIARANEAQREAIHKAFKGFSRKEKFDWRKVRRLSRMPAPAPKKGRNKR